MFTETKTEDENNSSTPLVAVLLKRSFKQNVWWGQRLLIRFFFSILSRHYCKRQNNVMFIVCRIFHTYFT